MELLVFAPIGSLKIKIKFPLTYFSRYWGSFFLNMLLAPRVKVLITVDSFNDIISHFHFSVISSMWVMVFVSDKFILRQNLLDSLSNCCNMPCASCGLTGIKTKLIAKWRYSGPFNEFNIDHFFTETKAFSMSLMNKKKNENSPFHEYLLTSASSYQLFIRCEI